MNVEMLWIGLGLGRTRCPKAFCLCSVSTRLYRCASMLIDAGLTDDDAQSTLTSEVRKQTHVYADVSNESDPQMNRMNGSSFECKFVIVRR